MISNTRRPAVNRRPAGAQELSWNQESICRVVDSPIGPLTLVGAGGTLTRLVLPRQRREADRSRGQRLDPQAFPDVVAQVGAYFDGVRTGFDVDLGLAGTDFQRRVWAAVESIPYGQTRSYAQIAAQIGIPGASRAVGFAVGRNPVPIIVACHRVIGSAGDLTGYAGGLECKKALLAHEALSRVVSRRPSSPPESRRPAVPAPH